MSTVDTKAKKVLREYIYYLHSAKEITEQEAIDQIKSIILAELMKGTKTYDLVTYDFGTALVVGDEKAIPVTKVEEVLKGKS